MKRGAASGNGAMVFSFHAACSGRPACAAMLAPTRQALRSLKQENQ